MRMQRAAWTLVLVLSVAALLAIPLWADSQARIVRLSDVQGDVRIDRRAGEGSERAILNLPITQGTRLTTGENGRAEIEFEDGSTIRLTAQTEVEFSRLSLRDSGGKFTNVEVNEGIAYFNIDLGKHDDFTVDFGRRTLNLERSARFRINVSRSEARLAVSHGSVELTGGSERREIGKNHTATWDLENAERVSLANDYLEDPSDDWNHDQDEYHARNYGRNSGSPYAYGFSDLNYYGSYVDAPGYGQLWRPYFASYNWDPFWDGSWVYYQGVGYTWVSAYPWGWIPYRYGSWLFVPSYGWCWQPGYWNAWYPVPRVFNPPPTWISPQPPTQRGATVVVSHGGGGPRIQPLDPEGRLVRKIQSDSAGLGVPRGRMDLSVMSSGRVGPDMHPAPSGIADGPRPGKGQVAPSAAPSSPPSPTAVRTPPAPRPAPAPAPAPSIRISPGPNVRSVTVAPSKTSPH
jgi:hypothetical protein